MTASSDKLSRSQQILQCLAEMLQESSAKITTATLAKRVGVSEAALYRHFPSKTRMYESLLDYMDEAIFSRVNQITKSNKAPIERIYELSTLFLIFAERNPGFCKLLTGEAIAGEHERLHTRVKKVFERFSFEIKQIIKLAEMEHGLRPTTLALAQADLISAVVQGKIAQYVRDDFQSSPSQYWAEQFELISKNFFEPFAS